MPRPDQKTVLVSGASSGIGRACATSLAGAGFTVFATVRKPADAESLRNEGASKEIDVIDDLVEDSGAIVPIEMDVTEPASIAAAVEQVRAQLDGRGLDGLVNNAGTAVSAPMEYVSLDVVRREFDVNLFGQIAVTQAFLPLIRQARGRVVNMGSIGGRFTVPFGGVLCGCKSALRAMNDALRLELHPFGIHVSLIEPAAIHTPAVDKTLGDVESTIRAVPPEGQLRYAPMLREFTRRAYRRETQGSPPEVVARAVHHALTARRPRSRYPVGREARAMTVLSRFLPDRPLDGLRFRIFGMPAVFGGVRPAS